MDVSELSIEVKDLTKRYGLIRAIEAVTFTVAKGEIVGFLGPNGAGKSTTLNILCGLLSATSGWARICDLSVAYQPQIVKRHIGYMLEHNPLPDDTRVSEYLHFRACLKGIPCKEVKRRIDEVMDVCDLNRKARNKMIGKLSKGFRQRIGIADAILARPQVLVLDEPTIGLDPHQMIAIRSLLDTLRGKISVIFSSHILQEIEHCSDRIMILNHGHIVANGTPLQLRREFIPTFKYRLEVKGECRQLESVLEKIDPEAKLLSSGSPDSAGFYEIQIESRHEWDPSLVQAIYAHAQLRLKAFSPIEPTLEHIFLAATKRSWAHPTSVKSTGPDPNANLT